MIALASTAESLDDAGVELLAIDDARASLEAAGLHDARTARQRETHARARPSHQGV